MANERNRLNRRDILKGFGIGAIGLALGGKSSGPGVAEAAPGSPHVKKDQLFRTETQPAKVSLVKGSERRQITFQVLKNIEDEVLGSLGGKKKILIKPNFVVTSRQLAATHVDAIRGILDFLRPHYKGQIIIR